MAIARVVAPNSKLCPHLRWDTRAERETGLQTFRCALTEYCHAASIARSGCCAMHCCLSSTCAAGTPVSRPLLLCCLMIKP